MLNKNKLIALKPIQKIKTKIMKKLLSIVAIASFMTACNDSSTKVDTTSTDSTKMSNDAMTKDTSTMATPPATMDTSSAMSSSNDER